LKSLSARLTRQPLLTLLFYVFGEVLSRTAPFLLIPFLSRQLDPSGFGELSLYYGYVVLFSALFSLSLDTACAQYYYKKGNKNNNIILTISSIYYSLLLLLSLLLLFALEDSFFLALTVSSLSSLYMLHLVQFQARKLVLKYLSSQLLYTSIFSLTALVGVYLFKSYIAVGIAQCFAYVLLLPFLIKGKIKLTKKKYTVKYSLYLVYFGLPLVLHKSSAFLRDGFERILVSKFFSDYDLGIYFAAKQLALILLVLITVSNRAIGPYIMESLSKEKFNRKVFRAFIIGTLLFAFFVGYLLHIIPGERFMSFVFGEEYSASYILVPQVVCGALLYLPYTFAVNIMYFNRKVKFIALVTLLSSVLHVFWVCYFAYNKDLVILSYASIISNLLISFMICMKADSLLERINVHEK
jgi:O-antigen/teichoic acid export membrane protein